MISGGGTGIGAAIARGLASDGFDTLLVGRRAHVLEQTGMPYVVADLRDPTAADLVRHAVGERPVTAIVNNAGGFIGRDSDDLPAVARQWRETFDTNVLTAVVLTEALLPQIVKPGGRVVFFSSIAAQRGGGGPYSGAKAALHGWALDLAVQLGPSQVTVNVISPGFVEDTEFFEGRMTPAGYQSRVDATLVKRAGTPSDIADAVRWLVGPSGGYVTGQIINVNGGSVLGR